MADRMDQHNPSNRYTSFSWLWDSSLLYGLAAGVMLAVILVLYASPDRCYIEISGHTALIHGCENLPDLANVVGQLRPATGLSYQNFEDECGRSKQGSLRRLWAC
ncbi:MAG: putative triple gene block protein 3 [Hainan sediment alphaflexivirus 1]|nr:MAG: putative triple gene block protein 3 [Hainan sediment alphaflexivirus 1]